MAETKYGHLIKKLKYEASNGEYMTMPAGADLEGLDLSFAWGYRRQLGTRGGDGGIRHTHPYGECLIFTSLDYNNYSKLGAEIEIEVGEKAKKHVIDTPSIVIAPAGLPHGLVVTGKIDKPFGFLAISLGGEHKTEQVSAGELPFSGVKYGPLVKDLNMRDINRKSVGNADIISGWNGKEFENFGLNFTWAFHTGLGIWHERDPHVHPNDEALLFVGLDPDNPDYLGAEIEIAMGKELEKHVFDTPTVVIAPKGLVHCPLNTRRVDKPYGFSAICLNNQHTTTWLGEAKTE
ncbi:hypothetical protein ACFLYQ_03740 [Chloroflexota bacterium]